MTKPHPTEKQAPPTTTANAPVVFLHIPKTAGTTMRSILAREYRADKRYEISNDINQSILEFRHQPESIRLQYQLLQGHMSFGLHRYLRQPNRYVTILREPVTRAISDYAFVSTTEPHPLYETVSQMPIGDYMKSKLTGQLSNGQTRLLAGDCIENETGIPTVRDLTRQDFDQAIDNIARHFAVVGLQERFDESLLLMRRRLGWHWPFYVKENVTRRAAKPDVGNDDLALIREQNRLDLELYDRMRESFERQITAAGLTFRLELIAFRAMNRLFKAAALAHPKHARRVLGPLLRPYLVKRS